MGKKVKITCEYYFVKNYTNAGKEEGLYDLRHWFANIVEKSMAELTKAVGDEKGRLEGRDKIDDRFYALNFIRMQAYSSAYIVKENEKASHVDINVDEDEYIGNNTVALYDSKKGIIMIMKNRSGFSAFTIQSYINSFF